MWWDLNFIEFVVGIKYVADSSTVGYFLNDFLYCFSYGLFAEMLWLRVGVIRGLESLALEREQGLA